MTYLVDYEKNENGTLLMMICLEQDILFDHDSERNSGY